MKWKNRRQSTNVEDRRRAPVAGLALGGGSLVIVVLALLFGMNPQDVLEQVSSPGTSPASSPGVEQPFDPHQEELKEFVSVVLADTEDVWDAQFSAMGRQYRYPTLVLFSGQVDSACGFASAAVGPFYCAGDDSVYLDLSFLDELQTRFGAPGDFAGAYVIAHEVGHHIQNQLGTLAEVDAMRGQASAAEANELSVRLELQADFLAGVWAHHAQQAKAILEPGDIEEALNAASAIGDDRLQRESQGYIVPDSFTHGTSAQRARWFRLGYETGDLTQGDTFSAATL